MDIISYKSLDQINQETQEKRKEKLPLYDGNVLNNFLKINDENLHEFYSHLNDFHKQLLFSKAEDEYLDDKGKMINCDRLSHENNEQYRDRISKHSVASSKANRTSLEIIKDEIPEIVSLSFEPYTFGTGSFSVSVMTSDVVTSEEILNRVRTRIQADKAFGNKYEVISPDILNVDISIKVFIGKEKSDGEKDYIRNKIKEEIRKYINSLKLQETLSKDKIESIIFEAKSVKNYEVFNFKINEKDVNFKNQVAEWNERFLENDRIDAITII